MGAPHVKVVNVTMDNIFARDALLPALGRMAQPNPDQLKQTFGFAEVTGVIKINGAEFVISAPPRRSVSCLPDRFGCEFQKQTRLDDKLPLRKEPHGSIINQFR